MINDDNACIRYLMKEMDPSEEVLMERAMMEDDNLLIEVECMRQMLKQLDKLPEVAPPAHLTDSIIKEAVAYRRNNLKSSHFIPFLKLKYAAAAIIVIGTTVGGYLLSEDHTPEESSNDTSQKVAMQALQRDNNDPKQMRQNDVQEASHISSVSNDIPAPWVDRNDVIYFQDHYSRDNSAFRSLVKSSTEKLTPLNGPFYYNSNNTRSLHLTGSETRQ